MCYLRSFDQDCLVRLKEELNCEIPLIQLINAQGLNGDSPEPSDETLRFVATYAAGIGPNIKLFYVDGIMGADASFNTLAQRARDHGLLLMPYTFKREDLPSGMTLEALIRRFVFELGVDALMTDFPDVALEVIQEK